MEPTATVSKKEHVGHTSCSRCCNALLFKAHLTRIRRIALQPKVFRFVNCRRLGGAGRHIEMRASEFINTAIGNIVVQIGSDTLWIIVATVNAIGNIRDSFVCMIHVVKPTASLTD
jgi:hypothetical protein